MKILLITFLLYSTLRPHLVKYPTSCDARIMPNMLNQASGETNRKHAGALSVRPACNTLTSDVESVRTVMRQRHIAAATLLAHDNRRTGQSISIRSIARLAVDGYPLNIKHPKRQLICYSAPITDLLHFDAQMALRRALKAKS